jgi:hypothetical protein
VHEPLAVLAATAVPLLVSTTLSLATIATIAALLR